MLCTIHTAFPLSFPTRKYQFVDFELQVLLPCISGVYLDIDNKENK